MIIVTGGAGFIGSAIIAALNGRDINDILVVDHLGRSDKWKNLRSLSFADYVEKDDFLKMISQGGLDFPVEAIFHLGACSSTTETDCSYLLRNNYEYSKVLASWATENHIRFIYASSAATYGDGSRGFVDNQNKISELEPLNMYGYSKQMFDLWARRTGLLGKIVGVKYFNVYGPNEYHKGDMRSFVLKAFYQIQQGGKVQLFKSHKPDFGDGQQMRDFVYIKDAVNMTLFFYYNPNINGIFNIGTGQAQTWNDLAKAVFNAMGKPVNIEYIDMPEHLRGKYQYFTQADINKIRQAGFKDKITPMDEAVRNDVQEYLAKEAHLRGV